MAGDWIPVTKALPRKREVLAIAAETSRSRADVVLALLDFWFWVDDECVDGQLPGMTLSHLPGLFPGTDAAFWLAVTSAGWLIQRTTGLEVPNFTRWLGQSAKRRLVNAQRKRDERKNERKTGPPKRPKNVRKMSASKADKIRTTEQNRTEEKSSGEVSPDPSSPPSGEKQKAPRPRDELFDSVVEVTGADPKLNGRHVGAVCAELRQADPPYTSADVRAFPAAITAHGFDFPVTVGSLGKWIYLVRLKVLSRPPPRRKDGQMDFSGLEAFAQNHQETRNATGEVPGDHGLSQLGNGQAGAGETG